MPVTGTGSTRLELSLKRPSSGGELEELIALGGAYPENLTPGYVTGEYPGGLSL